ncbi:hypothetical protein [Rhizobium halophilum]|uniref:hypothetical protein n=1 Tax=Rhizobium halophilum TaxID=2846852 RepID=UPI001EFEC64A|nr:hypothetical protein [Rhizobium halophilum]MCF6371085.1 hypothetical protein [Rhizobium halophilum]
MYGTDWPEPVVVEHKVPNKPIVVWSNEEAVNCLMGNWPSRDLYSKPHAFTHSIASGS